VFVSTRSQFDAARAGQIAGGLARHIGVVSKGRSDFSAETVLSRLHVFHCGTLASLLSCVAASLPALETDPPVRLVAVDSLSFLLRGVSSNTERALALAAIMEALNKLSRDSGPAVLVVNDATVKGGGDEWAGEGGGEVVPALGEAMAGMVATRIRLGEGGGQRDAKGCEVREAEIIKGVMGGGGGRACFVVTEEGVRGAKL
jgi:hypothetical protein